MRDAAGQHAQRLQFARAQQFFFHLLALVDFSPQTLGGLVQFGRTPLDAKFQLLVQCVSLILGTLQVLLRDAKRLLGAVAAHHDPVRRERHAHKHDDHPRLKRPGISRRRHYRCAHRRQRDRQQRCPFGGPSGPDEDRREEQDKRRGGKERPREAGHRDGGADRANGDGVATEVGPRPRADVRRGCPLRFSGRPHGPCRGPIFVRGYRQDPAAVSHGSLLGRH